MELIKDKLISLGFTSRESKIYLDMYTNGNDTINSISTSTGINRITVHSAVDQLILKNIIYESRDGLKRKLLVYPPDHLVSIVQEKQRELNLVFENALSLAELFKTLPQKNYSVPIISVYKGVNGLKRLLDETLTAKGQIKIIIDIDQFRELLSEEYLIEYYKKRAKRNIKSKLIWPDVAFAKKIIKTKEKYKMDVRTIKGYKNWKVGIFAWDNILAIKSLTRGNLVCTVIKSREISDFYQKLLYESIWNSLEKYV